MEISYNKIRKDRLYWVEKMSNVIYHQIFNHLTTFNNIINRYFDFNDMTFKTME